MPSARLSLPCCRYFVNDNVLKISCDLHTVASENFPNSLAPLNSRFQSIFAERRDTRTTLSLVIAKYCPNDDTRVSLSSARQKEEAAEFHSKTVLSQQFTPSPLLRDYSPDFYCASYSVEYDNGVLREHGRTLLNFPCSHHYRPPSYWGLLSYIRIDDHGSRMSDEKQGLGNSQDQTVIASTTLLFWWEKFVWPFIALYVALAGLLRKSAEIRGKARWKPQMVSRVFFLD